MDEPDEPLHQLFFVYTPTGVQTCLTEHGVVCSGTGFAGYHSQFGESHASAGTIYAYIADLGPLPGMGVVFPNNQYADSAISTSSHELFESVTDPYFQGWYTHSPAFGNLEMADLCSPSRGSDLGPTDASGANVTLNGHPYQVQLVYSNAAHGCTSAFNGQFINFGALGNTAYGTAPFSLSADATSLLPVSFSAAGACTVSNALVTVTGVGACAITASQGGNTATGGFYDPATPVTRTFNITTAAPAFTFDLATLPAKTWGDPDFSVANYASKPAGDSGAITFATGSGSVGCSVTSDGTVTISGATGAGYRVIAAALAADSNFVAAGPISQSFGISMATSSVAVTCPTVNPTYTGSQISGCTATVSGAGGLSQSLTVSYTGRNTTSYPTSTTPPTNAGDYTASASFSGDANDTGSSNSADVSIARATPVLSWNTPADITYGAALGGAQLAATANVPGAFAYTPASGATLNAGNGQTLSVTFTPTDTTSYASASTSVHINVAQVTQAITFGALGDMALGSPSFTVTAAGGASGNPVTFSAGPADVCSASGTNGRTIALVGVGTCSVTASQAGNTNYSPAADVVQRFSITNLNVAPTVTITAPVLGAVVRAPYRATLTAPFTDAGDTGVHTCGISWGDGASTGRVVNAGDPGVCNATHAYPAAGVYTIQVTVTDTAGAQSSASVMLVVYDPAAGFVAGGGWINSPAGAYKANPGMTGKVTFGFVSKYKTGANVPSGVTYFQFETAGFSFTSVSYQWLVVNQGGGIAQFKGTGTINGSGSYSFMIWAGDGSPDTFRIQITDNNNAGAIVYDNGVQQRIGGGSIVIHSGK